MTRDERSALDQLFEYVRDWRREDTDWKKGADARLRKVETDLAAHLSAHKAEGDFRLSLRARLGLAITALGVVSSLVLGILNIVR